MKDFFRDRHLVSNPYVNFLEVFVLLLFLWIVMSGIFTLKFITFGCISAFLISIFVVPSLRIGGLKSDKTYFILHANYLKLVCYFLWLIKEIIKSAVAVTRVVINSKERIKPSVIWFKADYDNPAARAILANSITLTPGTVTIDIYDDGAFSVHALNDDFAEGLLGGEMQRRIARLYDEEIDYKIVKVEVDKNYNSRQIVELSNRRFTRRKHND